MNLPRDFQSHPSFQNLVARIGNEPMATHIFIGLWVQLDYQAELHGRAGGFLKDQAANFSRWLKADTDLPITALQSARLLVDDPDPDYWLCKWFRQENLELDANHRERGDYRKQFYSLVNPKKIILGTARLVEELPPAIWEKGDGSRMTPSEMNRAVVLIRTVDQILKRPEPRDIDQYETGLIADAHRVTSELTDAKLEIILCGLAMRLYGKTRGRHMPDTVIPSQTEMLLKQFGDVAAQVCPMEGILKL
jgi:hypothetical protein